jgi:hypothetical protein
LKLPFAGGMCDDNASWIHQQKETFSKHQLLQAWSLEFRNPDVESLFICHWYLMDPFPFENPNAAVLHQGTFRVIRLTVMTAMLNQVYLAIQVTHDLY